MVEKICILILTIALAAFLSTIFYILVYESVQNSKKNKKIKITKEAGKAKYKEVANECLLCHKRLNEDEIEYVQLGGVVVTMCSGCLLELCKKFVEYYKWRYK